MATIEMFLWWYTNGWAVFIKKVRAALASVTDFFSMDSLIRTLFQPYRQISAETATADSSLELKFHMFIDRLISRIVGFISRLILLLAGLIVILIGSIFSLISIIIWPFVPFLPLVGIILSVSGVVL